MLSPTVENYLRQIHAAQAPGRAVFVPMKRLADSMEVSPGTATAMARTLLRAGLVRYEPRKGVRLTAEGERQALRVLRRHRLIELFLVKVLGQDWADVHEDAHRLEHAISQRVEEAMDRVLEHPSFDPHGDPIPGGDGEALDTRSLAQAPPGAPVRVSRIKDQSTDFLHFAARVGLVPGAVVTRLATDVQAGTTRVRLPDGEISLSASTMEKIWVATDSGKP